MVWELVGLGLFVLLLAALYVWARRVEADAIYEPREKSEDEATALRFAIFLNASANNVGGR